jgi:hypothetical protein
VNVRRRAPLGHLRIRAPLPLASHSLAERVTGLWRRSSRFRVDGNGWPHQRSAVNSCGWDQIPPACLRNCGQLSPRRRTIYLGDPQQALADTSVFIGLKVARFDVSCFENLSGCLCENSAGVAARRAAMPRPNVFPRVVVLIKAHRQISVTTITADAAHTAAITSSKWPGSAGRTHLRIWAGSWRASCRAEPGRRRPPGRIHAGRAAVRRG